MSRTKKPRLTPNPWAIMTDAVENGIQYGLRRADKHAGDDALTAVQAERVAREVYQAITLEMSERFLWNDET